MTKYYFHQIVQRKWSHDLNFHVILYLWNHLNVIPHKSDEITIINRVGNSHRFASPRPTTLEEDQELFVNFTSILCLRFEIQATRTYNFFDWVSNTDYQPVITTTIGSLIHVINIFILFFLNVWIFQRQYIKAAYMHSDENIFLFIAVSLIQIKTL